MDNQNQGKSYKEEVTISADELVGKVKDLIREGNVRRVSIRNEEGRTLIEVPLTAGGAVAAAAVIVAPVLAAIGALAALAGRLTVVIERVDDAPGTQTPDQTTQQSETPRQDDYPQAQD
ncbi:MAG: DUF4342 domain-containing protein [Chloroflexota bacterium]